jgi:phosphoglycerate kinase
MTFPTEPSFEKPQAINLDQITNSTVLVRVSFDIPSFDDIERILDAIPTIKQLLEQKNKLILCTKWGKIKEKIEIKEMINHPKSTSLLLPILAKELKKVLPEYENNLHDSDLINYRNQFAAPSFAELKIDLYRHNFKFSPIVLLENTHFDPREKSKNEAERIEIAEEYAKLADFFVDEGFSSSHRVEATNTEIKTLLLFSFGLSFAREVENLEKLKTPEKPFIILMGGAKLETKLPLLKRLLPVADKILVGGLLAFTFIKAANLNSENSQNKIDLPEIFDSKVEEDFVATAQELLRNYPEKIVLPSDFVYDENLENSTLRKTAGDIGELTIAKFGREIENCKTLFWNGPMGFFEKKPFDQATHQIAEIITKSQCFSVLGGGDTNASLGKEILDKFGFVSMAGGATLDFLSR